MSSTDKSRPDLAELERKIFNLISSANANAGIGNLGVCVSQAPDDALVVTITGTTGSFYRKQQAQQAALSCPDLNGILFDLKNKIVVV